jgi:hypothetical protein
MHGDRFDFSFSSDGKVYHPLGPAIVPESAAWMGAKIGLFALNRGPSPSGGTAEYAFFQYEPLLD